MFYFHYTPRKGGGSTKKTNHLTILRYYAIGYNLVVVNYLSFMSTKRKNRLDRATIFNLRSEGYSYDDIAVKAGVTRQRIHQIIAEAIKGSRKQWLYRISRHCGIPIDTIGELKVYLSSIWGQKPTRCQTLEELESIAFALGVHGAKQQEIEWETLFPNSKRGLSYQEIIDGKGKIPAVHQPEDEVAIRKPLIRKKKVSRKGNTKLLQAKIRRDLSPCNRKIGLLVDEQTFNWLKSLANDGLSVNDIVRKAIFFFQENGEHSIDTIEEVNESTPLITSQERIQMADSFS